MSTPNAQRSASTRGALIAAGKQLFAKHGYAGVSTQQIVKTAKVTRGALYHHFEDKRDLFRAVYEEVERDVVVEIAEQVAGQTDPWKLAIDGSMAFLDICLDPAFQRIAITDAPAVLGTAEYREIAERYGGALIEATLTALIDAGEIEQLPVKPLARMLTGALIEGGVVIATAEDEKAARREVGEITERLLRSLATKTS
ncbi:MAG: TetR/AcrR family transcriptional regulator [Solirubrobacterales bacterium]